MSSFWKPVCNYKHIKKTFVSPGKNLLLYLCKILLLKLSLKQFSLKSKKRMSFFSPLPIAESVPGGRKLKAGMAVEASLCLPLFLFFLLNVLTAFDMLRLHGNLAAAMHQTGNQMAFYGYAYRAAAGEEAVFTDGLDSLVMSEGYARGRVVNILGKEYLEHSCLSAGTSGLHFLKSSVMENNDVIELVASYHVKPFLKIMGFPDFPMENRYYGRAWTGYDVTGGQDGAADSDPVVYVAKNGTVYHTARNCTYLNPSVEAVPAGTTAGLRNESGGKYEPCGRCRISQYQALVYLTAQGDRIHGSLQCPGLKRTIYAIRLSEAGGKGKCSKCGAFQTGSG